MATLGLEAHLQEAVSFPIVLALLLPIGVLIMIRPYEIRDFFVISILAMTLTGCVTAAAHDDAIRLVSNADIVVVRATAHRKKDGILIGGDVRRTNGYAGAVPGHLEVIARDRSGSIIAAVKATWGEFMTRRFRLAYFSAFLRVSDPSAIATISIEPVTARPE